MSTHKTVVLYHGPTCVDSHVASFAAAWAAYRSLGDQALYLPAWPGQVPPGEALLSDRLYLLGVSYSLEWLLGLARQNGEGVTAIDRHKASWKTLADFQMEVPDRAWIVYDQAKSSAVLAWQYFYPGEDVPLLLRYVQDRDLGSLSLPMSRALNAFIGANHRDFTVWDWLTECIESPAGFELAKGAGCWILEAQARLIEGLVARPHWVEIAGHQVPTVNSSMLQREIGAALCLQYSEAPFAAVYFSEDRETEVWSLRSRGGFDVAKVAAMFGGGGHAGSAAFRRGRGESLNVVEAAEVVGDEAAQGQEAVERSGSRGH